MYGMRRVRFSLVIGVAVFAAIGFGAANAESATSPRVDATLTASARPAGSTACGPDGTLLTPSAVRTDRLGVKYYTYRAAPGMVTKVPPSGLTAARVTPALLTDIGLESAAAAKRELTTAARRSLDREAISLSAGAPPRFCVGTAKDRGLFGGQLPKVSSRHPSSPKSLGFNIYADNYGGYGITESEFGGQINAAEGAWTVGQGKSTGSSEYPSVEESTWVGVGGLGDASSAGGIIQAGVAMMTDPTESSIPAGYTSWFQVMGTSGCNADNNYCDPVWNAGDSTRPGDAVLVQVDYISSATGCFSLVDYTHSSGDIEYTCLLSAVYDHTSGEWVNESWLANGYLYNNPGTISLNTQNVSGDFGGGSWQQAFVGDYQTVIMETDSIDQYGDPSLGEPGVSTCPGDGALLSKGVNASGSSSQIASYNVAGCN